MKKFQILSMFMAGAWFVATGCGAPDGENPFDAEDFDMRFQGTAAAPPSGDNGDSPTCFWSDEVQDALRMLGKDQLDQGGGILPSMPLVSTECRHIIKSAVMCALNATQTLKDADTEASYTGWWGLAPNWETGPLDAIDDKDGRWVTACMLQKLNVYKEPVPILLVGDHEKIKDDPLMNAAYPYQEATIFGNLFTSTTQLGRGNVPFQAHVCIEDDMDLFCVQSSAYQGMLKRICHTSSQCNLTNLGLCKTAGVASGPYWKFPSQGYDEAIRVQLPTGMEECYDVD